ncbi:MAG: glycosyltransferase family 4 protein [Calothrix sp. CSU_2_0]|nr:glycosyltransferase family 4 protein [Calothrix sp. CSU_2_0]
MLSGLQIGKAYQDAPIFFNPGIIYQLWKQQTDVIIFGGWQHFTYWLALVYTEVMGVRLLIWSESTLKDERSASKLKDKLKRWIVSKADGYIVPGKAQKDYLLYLGAKNERIWVAPNAVDTDFFTSKTELYRQDRETLKQKLNLNGIVILSVGRLIDEKGIPELLAAFAQLKTNQLVTLVIVGDGSQSEEYQHYCQQKQLNNVVFSGFQNQNTLVQYYAIADIFVFPTRTDPWGLVLNEAMSASLPIVCSSSAGAVDDLIEDGGNGFIFSVGNVTLLAEALQRLVDDEDLRKRMGMRSHEIILNYTPQIMAQGLQEAIVDDKLSNINKSKFISLH